MNIKYEASDGTLHDTKRDCHVHEGKSIAYVCCNSMEIAESVFSEEENAKKYCESKDPMMLLYYYEEVFVDENM